MDEIQFYLLALWAWVLVPVNILCFCLECQPFSMVELCVCSVLINGYIKIHMRRVEVTLIQQHISQVKIVVWVTSILSNCKVKESLSLCHSVLMVVCKSLILVVE